MNLIILAGGQGTRLRPLVSDRPKPMALVGPKPFLQILLERMCIYDIKKIIISIGYKSNEIITYFGSNINGIPIDYAVELSPLGTGGAVRNSLKYCNSDTVVVTNGDSFVDINLHQVLEFHKQTNLSTIVAIYQENVSRFGALQFDENDNCSGFSEKNTQGPGYINTGLYMLSLNDLTLNEYPANFSFEVSFISNLIKSRKMCAFRHVGHFIDIGVPSDYLRVQDFFESLA